VAQYRLFSEVCKVSQNSSWEQAKLEWELFRVYQVPEGEESETCLCGKYPIREVCVLVNRLNKNLIEVGNQCVNRFFELPSEQIFSGIRRVQKDIAKSFTEEVILHALEKGVIDQWKHDFYRDIFRRRKLTVPRLQKKIQINRLILKAILEKRF